MSKGLAKSDIELYQPDNKEVSESRATSTSKIGGSCLKVESILSDSKLKK